MTNFDTEEDLFFKYLDENGLKGLENSYILEYALDVESSLSRLIVSKYGELYKQFLVARCFDKNNSYNVNGIRGNIYMKSFDTKIEYLPPFFEDKIITSDLLNRKRKIPKENDFNVLLIRGMTTSLFSLYQSKLSKLFGNVVDEEDNNYKSLYEAIFRLIKSSSDHEYELCHDRVSELGKELYLIKRR